MFDEKLEILKKKNLFRSTQDRQSPQGPKILFDGREYINFSSNDYLGLSNHPFLIKEIEKALNMYGYGGGASRLLSGGSMLHKELEDRIARFKDNDAALVFNSGYAANTGIIPAIADKNTVLFSDELNHASIIDGCRLSGSKTLVYKHRDLDHLEKLFRKEGNRKKILITDTVFSMDGDIAPLKELSEICRHHQAILYLDEAHSTGVMGNGKGALAHFNMKPEPWIIQMGTFSKAFGSFGAFLSGNSDIIQWTVNNARSFMYSTALPSCIIAASLAALELIENNPELIIKLWANRHKAAKDIQDAGYDIMGSETPILPVRTGSLENTLSISKHLGRNGIFAPAIRPPTVKEARIRINITTAHTEEDIGRLIQALKSAR